MKSLLIASALVLATSSAFANAVTVMSTRVQNAVQTAAGNTSVNVGLLARINAASALSISGANLAKLEGVVKKIESSVQVVAADNNDNMNGIPKAKRLEAVMLAYVALVKNMSEGTPSADLEKVLMGELFQRSIAPVSGEIGEAQYDKYVQMMKLYVEQGKSAEDASREATGGTLAAFANACGGASAASRR